MNIVGEKESMNTSAAELESDLAIMKGIWAHRRVLGAELPVTDDWVYIQYQPGVSWRAVTSAAELELDLAMWRSQPKHWKRMLRGCTIHLRAVPK
jgi:hypothetical protein